MTFIALTDNLIHDISIPDHTPAIDKWPKERVDQLRELIAQQLSASEIATALSELSGETYTRNAVIGKAHRAGIPLQGYSKPKPLVTKRKPKPVSPKNEPPPKGLPIAEVISNPLRLSILEIERGQCYWPVDIHETPALFCGHPTGSADVSWCRAHRKLGYVVPSGRA